MNHNYEEITLRYPNVRFALKTKDIAKLYEFLKSGRNRLVIDAEIFGIKFEFFKRGNVVNIRLEADENVYLEADTDLKHFTNDIQNAYKSLTK